ncbi:hypothetical protein [Kerstersia gyiorum]|uniref:hypothetical protein n=1 Tax=Kerstersia gyiorum TaxID=206506 RepID=UPI003B4303CD
MNTKLIVILVAAVVAVTVVVINIGGGETDSKPSAEGRALPATKGFTHTTPHNSAQNKGF